MEDWEKEIIVKNMIGLVNNTSCNVRLLAALQASGILGDDDLDILEGLVSNRGNQVFQLYTIIQKREHAFEALLEALQKTNQSGAVAILTKSLGQNTSSVTLTISYDVNTILGNGSYGTVVYKGTFGDRDVAVKKVHLSMFAGNQALHEVKVLKDVDAHENVVRYCGAKQTKEFILIALELCEMSLTEWVENNVNNEISTFDKTMEFSCMEVLRHITTGLEWLHSKKIVHRDIKPENVLLLLQMKRAKLSDFGLSRRVMDGNSFVATSNVGGTPGWMAPEILTYVVQRKSTECKYSYASDVFSLGCVFYYVLTDGKYAFGDAVRCQANILDGNSIVAESEIKHGIARRHMVEQITLMISKEPKSRPTCTSLLSQPLWYHNDLTVRLPNNTTQSSLTNQETCRIPVTDSYPFQNEASGEMAPVEDSSKPDLPGAMSVLKGTISPHRKINMDKVGCFSYDKGLVLGKGSNGTVVFKGRFGVRDVAVKQVNSENEQNKIIIKEIENLINCNEQENIVSYYGTSAVENGILIVFELCDTTLKDWLPQKPIKISPIEVLRQITVGLEFLHSLEIVHGDLKPENILLTSDPILVKISDFGRSMRLPRLVSSSGNGIQGWVAPEILLEIEAEDSEGCKFSFESDIFSLGCLYYYVLMDGKQHPFGSELMRITNILNGCHTVEYWNIQYASAENMQFITIMISNIPQSRPSCSTILTYPIFLTNSQQHKISTNQNSTDQIAADPDQIEKAEVKSRRRVKESKDDNDTVGEMMSNSKSFCSTTKTFQSSLLKDISIRNEIINNKFVTSTNSSKSLEDNKITPPMEQKIILANIAVSNTFRVRTNSSNISEGTSIIQPTGVRTSPDKKLVVTQTPANGLAVSSKNNPAQTSSTSNESLKLNICSKNEKMELVQLEKVNKYLYNLKRMTYGHRIMKLMTIVFEEDLCVIRSILEQEGAPNHTKIARICDFQYRTMLHYAVARGDYDIVEYLINSHGFETLLFDKTFSKNVTGDCIRNIHDIDDAGYKSKCKILELLFSKRPQLIDSKIDDYEGCGWTPLHAATRREFRNGKQLEFIQFLLKHNADVNAKTTNNNTPLQLAVREPVPENVIEITRLLITHGADPNAVNGEGYKFWEREVNFAS